MLTTIFAQAVSDEFIFHVILYLALAFSIFVAILYLFRSIFNIPSFLRYQKAQIRLLEEIAKTQGVDGKTVEGIVSESQGWDSAPVQPAAATKSTAQ
jgi:hypothetical protein